MRMNRRDVVMGGAALAAVSLLERGALAGTQAIPEVATTGGRIRGQYTADTSSARTGQPYPVCCFKGVPYGADTMQTRFAAPKPPERWQETRQCFDWGPRAPQVPGARPRAGADDAARRAQQEAAEKRGYHLPPDEGPESEDCLHLNVWTPALRGAGEVARRKLPVMFYIHGGAYSNGTVNAQLYDGARLAKRGDVVVVTVNHRLNIFGYLYLAELLRGQGFEDSGNAGQLDLVLALQWVRDNIANFGGDPGKVLIFGQSGGGAKCATLMAQPPAKGLFHRVISMSGQQVTGASKAHATERARAALKYLEVDTSKPTEAAQTLRTLPWQKIAEACRAHGYFGPVTDGRSLPVDPFAPTDPKLSTQIPMMLGNMHDETRVLIGGGQPALFSLTWETLPAALEKNGTYLKSDTISLPVPEVIAKYREWHPDYSASDVFFAVTTDSRSWRGEVIEANARAADPAAQPHTWVYQLNWKTPVDGGRFGSPHTLDIPLAFDNVALSPGMVGSSEEDKVRAQQMVDVVSDSYIAFARNGKPDNQHVPHWPAYDLKARATMIFDLPPRIENNPRGREREYLGQVPYVQPGT
jgi:para-nitrobenzyl esterase